MPDEGDRGGGFLRGLAAGTGGAVVVTLLLMELRHF
jgi:hypothetical protein